MATTAMATTAIEDQGPRVEAKGEGRKRAGMTRAGAGGCGRVRAAMALQDGSCGGLCPALGRFGEGQRSMYGNGVELEVYGLGWLTGCPGMFFGLLYVSMLGARCLGCMRTRPTDGQGGGWRRLGAGGRIPLDCLIR